MADPNQFIPNFSIPLLDIDPEFINPDFGGSYPTTNSPLSNHYDIDDTPPSHSQSHPSQTSTASTSTSSTGKKARRKTSVLWEHFEEETVVVEGVGVRKARCKWHECNSLFALQIGGGNGHMKRHYEGHLKASVAADKLSARRQDTLKFNPDGSRESLCRMVAVLDLPLGFGESEDFVEYIQTSHNPNFKPVSRQTTSRDMRKLCKSNVAKIKEELANDTFSLALTSDIWSGRAKQSYLSVVAHYVDKAWVLQKRVIGFELIDVSHSGENIANAIIHQRCACHIINLIAKYCLKKVETEIKTIRTGISYLGSCDVRVANYANYCLALGMTPHKYSLDMPVRWNSTYMMLKAIVKDQVQFMGFINANYGSILITPE
ncbi:unnamed protein product, partial [Alopecurus aequalis]